MGYNKAYDVTVRIIIEEVYTVTGTDEDVACDEAERQAKHDYGLSVEGTIKTVDAIEWEEIEIEPQNESQCNY